jgi:hypothetical protein
LDFKNAGIAGKEILSGQGMTGTHFLFLTGYLVVKRYLSGRGMAGTHFPFLTGYLVVKIYLAGRA